ncbi:MAG TPA: copper resistance CopC family protein, partial [Polyangiaceae bacterium]|nr:copper resistance CopC family protein [Polyangiaceae bacterium]
MRRALLITAIAALALPAQAFAHATLERTSPGFEQRVNAAPRTVTLRFDQYIENLPHAIRLYSTHRELPVPRIRNNGRDLIATVPRLRAGGYTIRWHALSGDGHVVSGLFTFGVRAKAPAPTEAFGASGPTRTEDVVRWLYFLSLALLVGGLGFRLLVARRRLPDRFFALAGVGAFATLNVGIAAFLLRAEDALQLPFGRLLYGDLSPIARTRFGTAFTAMTLGFSVVAAL